MNGVFLLLGLVISVLSKILQFKFHARVGDVLVLFAAIFFVLAVLYSYSPFVELITEKNKIGEATLFAVLSCLTVVSFQVMMIFVIGQSNKIGFIFIIPFLLSLCGVVFKWITVLQKI